MLKRLSLFFLVLLLSLTSLVSCKKKTDYSKFVVEKPDLSLKTGDYNLDFNVMHNFVIDYLSSEFMPFFFVKNGTFDISGDNDTKEISIKCTCINETVVSDLDLFLSMVLNGIAINANEQDYRFKKPSVLSDGSYGDYGTVFDVYGLKIYADRDDKTILRNNSFKPGETIPIDPRYIKE